jgi:hypothetical protein
MKEQIADQETSRMLKELLFDAPCIFMYNGGFNGKEFPLDLIDLEGVDFNKPLEKDDTYSNWATHQISAPYWQQVKEWLWEKHGVAFECSYEKEMKKIVCGGWKNNNELTTFKTQSKSPIESETKAIQQTIEYLHKQLINKK